MPGSSPGMTVWPSFRGARSASPESITTIGSMDSGLAPNGAPRNDRSHPALQRVADFVEHLGILDRCRHGPGIAIGDLLDGAAQDFARAGLRQAPDRDRELEGGDRAEFFAHQCDDLFLDLDRLARNTGLQHQEAARHLALDRILDAE